MIISNEPLAEGLPVKFKIKGFPVEEQIRLAVERFYTLKPEAKREFLVLNEFGEIIFSGMVDDSGRADIKDAGKIGKMPFVKPE